MVWTWAHNEFLQGLYEFGLIGMACVIGYIVNIHKKAQELMNDKAVIALYASFISIIILSCVQFPFHLGRFVPIMLFLMACLHAKLEEPKYA
jgi:O-antigen ligase